MQIKTGCEFCVLLGCYAAYSGISLPKFRENIWVPSEFQEFFTSVDGTDRLSQNVGKELLVYAAKYPSSAQISSTPQRKSSSSSFL
jgi:hypothetical protein